MTCPRSKAELATIRRMYKTPTRSSAPSTTSPTSCTTRPTEPQMATSPTELATVTACHNTTPDTDPDTDPTTDQERTP